MKITAIKIHDIENENVRIVTLTEINEDKLTSTDLSGCKTALTFEDVITMGKTIFEPVW